MANEHDRLLARLAGRLRDDASFFASVLHAYQVAERLSEQQLAAHLGLSPAALARLRMCRRPASGSPEFSGQIQQIAEYVGAEPAKLANMVRHVEAIESMREAKRPTVGEAPQDLFPGIALGFVSAARDKPKTDQGEESEPDQDESEQDAPDVDRQPDA